MGNYTEYEKKVIQWTFEDIQMERWFGNEDNAWRKLVRLTEYVMRKEKEYGKVRKPAPKAATKSKGDNAVAAGQGGPRTN